MHYLNDKYNLPIQKYFFSMQADLRNMNFICLVLGKREPVDLCFMLVCRGCH